MTITIGVIGRVESALGTLLNELGYTCAVLPEPSATGDRWQQMRVPQVVVADVRERPALLETLDGVKRRHPDTSLIIVARLDAELMLKAMRAGITECVTEPIDRAQLDAAIRHVSVGPSVVRGDVIAFVGAKGGVGTTTFAVNVATVLAKAGQSVLFADLHLAYADAALYFGAEPRFSIIDALENTNRLDPAFLKSIVVKTSSGVDLLASADRDPGKPVDLGGLPRLLELARSHYRFVVLDVARSGRAVVDPLAQADSIVVVANHELAALRSASYLAGGLRERHGGSRVSVVVNRFDRTSDITPKDIERAVGEPVLHTLPSDYRVALQALNNGKPLVLTNHSKLAAAIDTFAHGVAGISKQVQDADARSGLLGILTRKR